MRLIFLLSMLVSFSALPSTWFDLEEEKTYKLTQNFQLPQLERSHSLIDFSKGETFKLKEIIPRIIPGASLTLYLFEYKNCPGAEMVTDIEIIDVTDSRPLIQVGMKVQGCELNMFLENKDLSGKSLFE
jgi:hypothetical protein